MLGRTLRDALLKRKYGIVSKIVSKSHFAGVLFKKRSLRKMGDPVDFYVELNTNQQASYDRYKKQGKLHEEIRILGGDRYPEKTFFVVRIPPSSSGICTHYYFSIIKMLYAIEKGYVPVVDMRHFRNIYHRRDEVGKTNTWDCFFRQPMNYKLEDIYRAKNLILSNTSVEYYRKYMRAKEGPLDYLYGKNSYIPLKRIADKYVFINDDIKREADEIYRSYFGEEGKKHLVLGINLRGTEYTELRPYGHPIQPKLSTVIDDAKRMIREYGCTDVYLNTEDESIFNRLKDRLEVNVYRYKQRISDFRTDWGHCDPSDPCKSGKDYLISVLLLSKTDYLLSCVVGSTYAVVLFPDSKWIEKRFYWDGLYGIDD